jgi:hypothetical protein
VSHQVVTDEDLELARRDPTFRKQLLAANLDYLLAALARLRACENPDAPVPSRQIREGVQLAVRLAEILQRAGGQPRLM